MNPKESRCHSCDARIYWGETARGKRVPVDVEPVSGGNILLRIQAGTGKVLADHLTEAETFCIQHGQGPMAGAKVRRCHWETCQSPNRGRSPAHGASDFEVRPRQAAMPLNDPPRGDPREA